MPISLSPVYGGKATPLRVVGEPVLEQAVALAGRFLRARGRGQALSVQGPSTLLFAHQGRSHVVDLVVGGFPAPGRSFAALTWGRAIHFRTVPEGPAPAGEDQPPRNSLLCQIGSGAPRSTSDMAALLAHELVHIEQQHRAFLGLAGFLAAYLLGWARGGFRYRTNPYEVAARARQEEALSYFASLPAEAE